MKKFELKPQLNPNDRPWWLVITTEDGATWTLAMTDDEVTELRSVLGG